MHCIGTLKLDQAHGTIHYTKHHILHSLLIVLFLVGTMTKENNPNYPTYHPFNHAIN